MNLLDPIGEKLVGNAGPDYVREEAGIFLATVLWLVLAALVATSWLSHRLPEKN